MNISKARGHLCAYKQHTMETCGGVEVQYYTFSTFSTRWRLMIASRPGRFNQRPLDRLWVEVEEVWILWKREKSAPFRNRIPVINPIAVLTELFRLKEYVGNDNVLKILSRDLFSYPVSSTNIKIILCCDIISFFLSVQVLNSFRLLEVISFLFL
jgi:hypothetical protein